MMPNHWLKKKPLNGGESIFDHQFIPHHQNWLQIMRVYIGQKTPIQNANTFFIEDMGKGNEVDTQNGLAKGCVVWIEVSLCTNLNPSS